MTLLYEICLKFIKLLFSTVVLKQTQGNDHLEVGDSVEITNKMQPCIRIYYSTVN